MCFSLSIFSFLFLLIAVVSAFSISNTSVPHYWRRPSLSFGFEHVVLDNFAFGIEVLEEDGKVYSRRWAMQDEHSFGVLSLEDSGMQIAKLSYFDFVKEDSKFYLKLERKAEEIEIGFYVIILEKLVNFPKLNFTKDFKRLVVEVGSEVISIESNVDLKCYSADNLKKGNLVRESITDLNSKISAKHPFHKSSGELALCILCFENLNEAFLEIQVDGKSKEDGNFGNSNFSFLPEFLHWKFRKNEFRENIEKMESVSEILYQQKLFERFPDIAQSAKHAINELLGNLGFFNQHILIGSRSDLVPINLYSGVPSSGRFSHPFFWDEGFHLLLRMEWNVHSSMEIIKSWSSLAASMDKTGFGYWIPREVCSGYEALKMKSELKGFLRQDVSIFNPPTILLALNKMLDLWDNSEAISTKIAQDFLPDLIHRCSVDGSEIFTLASRNLPHKFAYFIIKNTFTNFFSQVTPILSSHLRLMESKSCEKWNSRHKVCRWSGQTAGHTFGSGLDDFPRGLGPMNGTSHVDLVTWLCFGHRVLKRAFQKLGGDQNMQFASDHQSAYESLSKSLFLLFDPEKNAFVDSLGIHPVARDSRLPVTNFFSQDRQCYVKKRTDGSLETSKTHYLSDTKNI
eukprot:GHVP01002095.1.p1 GENE.GHVP01002095.1~~GHVP01002095.1.p1  ORF type:complete len:626 (+),score=109.88 GHVP01002095.1:142-2019(+)